VGNDVFQANMPPTHSDVATPEKQTADAASQHRPPNQGNFCLLYY